MIHPLEQMTMLAKQKALAENVELRDLPDTDARVLWLQCFDVSFRMAGGVPCFDTLMVYNNGLTQRVLIPMSMLMQLQNALIDMTVAFAVQIHNTQGGDASPPEGG